MTTSNKNKAPAFFEVVFRGKPKVVRSFLSGLVLGSCDGATIYYSFLDGVHHEGKAEKLAEMVGIRGVDCHVIVDTEVSALLKKLGKKIAAETGLSIISHRKIRGASLTFGYSAYARKYDEEILALLKKLPTELNTRGFKHKVNVDPKARGVEAYAPAHHFEAKGSGAITGPVDKVIELKKAFASYPLIKAEDIILKLA
ncbi:MAG: hypothetical protein KOO60_07120 [Gemmatimonadales bacterium]|nr:hypothetical protein [Gemmatimonadales bacterium]